MSSLREFYGTGQVAPPRVFYSTWLCLAFANRKSDQMLFRHRLRHQLSATGMTTIIVHCEHRA